MADVRERARITLTYRSAATGCVTSLVPCIELAYPSSGLFGPPSVSIVLHAIDSNGVTVAAPAASLQVDPTTGEIHVNRGQALKIPLRIQKKFEGDITVQAVDLSSGIAYATLKLTTDFHH